MTVSIPQKGKKLLILAYRYIICVVVHLLAELERM